MPHRATSTLLDQVASFATSWRFRKRKDRRWVLDETMMMSAPLIKLKRNELNWDTVSFYDYSASAKLKLST